MIMDKKIMQIGLTSSGSIEVTFEEVMPRVAETVAYCLADDEKLASRVMVAPDDMSDCTMMAVLWDAAAAWLGGLLSEKGEAECGMSEKLFYFTPKNACADGRVRLLKSTAVTALVSHIASAWLRNVNHLPDLNLSGAAATAAVSLQSQLMLTAVTPADDTDGQPAQRARLRLSPF